MELLPVEGGAVGLLLAEKGVRLLLGLAPNEAALFVLAVVVNRVRTAVYLARLQVLKFKFLYEVHQRWLLPHCLVEIDWRQLVVDGKLSRVEANLGLQKFSLIFIRLFVLLR